jgi:hypothetical protein
MSIDKNSFCALPIGTLRHSLAGTRFVLRVMGESGATSKNDGADCGEEMGISENEVDARPPTSEPGAFFFRMLNEQTKEEKKFCVVPPKPTE